MFFLRDYENIVPTSVKSGVCGGDEARIVAIMRSLACMIKCGGPWWKYGHRYGVSLRKTNRRARISDLRRSGLYHFSPLFDAGHAVCGCVVAGTGLLAAALGAALAMIVDSSAEIMEFLT